MTHARYTHLYSVGFTVNTNQENPMEVTLKEIQNGIIQSMDDYMKNDNLLSSLCVEDTYEDGK